VKRASAGTSAIEAAAPAVPVAGDTAFAADEYRKLFIRRNGDRRADLTAVAAYTVRAAAGRPAARAAGDNRHLRNSRGDRKTLFFTCILKRFARYRARNGRETGRSERLLRAGTPGDTDRC
jgi:hypothetical protein